jgi:hypothetical protein
MQREYHFSAGRILTLVLVAGVGALLLSRILFPGPVAPPPRNIPHNDIPPPLPKQGISLGYKVFTLRAAARQFELDEIQRAMNGHPGFVRVDDTGDNPIALDAVVAGILSRGLTPLLVLYGTTPPRPADSFGHDQAVKWLGKVSYFEIANEPDQNGWTPDSYADFVRATGRSVKSGNPHAVVIAGALFTGKDGRTTQDYAQALATRAKGSFDIVSLHLYGDPRTATASNIWDMAFPALFGKRSYYKGDTVREILDTDGLSSIPIISTESGGPVYTYGERGQNTIMSDDFDALNSHLLSSLIVYTMENNEVRGFGLLRDNDTERPAFQTFMRRAY